MRAAAALLTTLAGCNTIYGLDETRVRADDARQPCLPGTAFGAGTPVAITGEHSVEAARFTSTQSLAYLSLCPISGDKSACELYTSPFSLETRSFAGFSKMGGVSTAGAYDAYPTITADNQHLLFGSEREPGGVHIFVASTNNGSFDAPTITRLSAPSASSSNEPYVVGGRVLYYAAQSGSWRLFRMEGSPPQFGGQPVAVAGVDRTNVEELAPVPSEDERELFFASGANMALDIYVSTRASVTDAFGEPTRLALSTSGIDWPVWLAPDGCDLYYISKQASTATLFVARRSSE